MSKMQTEQVRYRYRYLLTSFLFYNLYIVRWQSGLAKNITWHMKFIIQLVLRLH